MNQTSNIKNCVYTQSQKALFSIFLDNIEKGVHFFQISKSFENYYLMIEDAIDFYKSNEDFKSCAILKNNIDNYLSVIPKNINEAIKFMIDSVGERNLGDFRSIDTYSLAINMHHTTGLTIKDMWLLQYPISPLRQFCEDTFGIQNTDEIINKIITIYIDTLKSMLDINDNLN